MQCCNYMPCNALYLVAAVGIQLCDCPVKASSHHICLATYYSNYLVILLLEDHTTRGTSVVDR